MKKIILMVPMFFIIASLFSQYEAEEQVLSKKERRKLEKEYKAAQREAAREEALKLTEAMLDQHRFVLEADYISGRSGSRYPVNSVLNFVMVDSSYAVLQVGSVGGVGYNGVGGITVEGRISRYNLTKKTNKKGTSYNLVIYMMSSLGTYDINMWIRSSGDADATIRGNVRGVINYSGRLVPLKQSRVYKGRSY